MSGKREKLEGKSGYARNEVGRSEGAVECFSSKISSVWIKRRRLN